ncbi:MAG: PA14 domain-containing protein, partial [Verrucomicrobiota bacterium]
MDVARFTLLLTALSLLAVNARAEKEHPGAAIYRMQCANCHGANGEGVDDEYDEALYGDDTLEELTRLIERTMPEKEPEACVGEDAAAVASYIFGEFYSEKARRKKSPPRVTLSRLTVNQYRNAVADLVGSFSDGSPFVDDPRRGLSGRYFPSRSFRIDKKKKENAGKEIKGKVQPPHESFQRTDSSIAFNFKDGSPDPAKMTSEEFSIRWEGSLLAEETGTYEILVRSENGFRFFLNGEREKALIDGWVSSGPEVRELKKNVFLLAARAYPIELQFFTFKEKTASIELLWKPPNGTLEIIPESHLTPQGSTRSLAVSTSFPADDRSHGYERGVSISKAWQEAATFAAIETANPVLERIDRLSRSREKDQDRLEKLKTFAQRFTERAFARPLSSSEQRLYIDGQFAAEGDAPETAVKKSILLTLTSPYFLYPGLSASNTPEDHFVRASRLSYALWDSLPDKRLREAAVAGQLNDPVGIREEARRLMADPRARTKLQGFFH